MTAVNQVAPERWPNWYAERQIDPIESGRRLEGFLRMRKAPYFKELQGWLVSGGKSAEITWKSAFQRDWRAVS
jgi:hypothetical protein